MSVASGASRIEVRSPYSGQVVGAVPLTDAAALELAIDAAEVGAGAMAALPAFRRSEILERAARAIEAGVGELARIITAEQGKHLAEAAAEAERIPGIVRLCAEEARRISGEVLPMDAAPVGEGRFGYTVPAPTGLVAAITPFNYPAILVVHKVGPALAAGNAVLLKPASATPLTASFLVERFVGAGLPRGALQLVAGSGSSLGAALCADERVRKISFTGSVDAGAAIARAAGVKRLTCELGSNAALVVLPDADLDRAAEAIAFSGFTNAGQNCVSTQRVLVHESRVDELLARLLPLVDALVTGDPADASTSLSPVIDESSAERVAAWIAEAGSVGGAVLRGGERDGTVVAPAVVLQPPVEARIWREELFGPGVAVRSFADDDEALAGANSTRYGLAMSVMTSDLDRAMRFAARLRAGIVHVNPPRGATWRADHMPWGGLADSGFGKEGVRYAVRDMVEDRLVVIHPGPGA
ncbi:MAG: aldehyde dehydrogenase family protein [Solirubrobacteraceae bacterium]